MICSKGKIGVRLMTIPRGKADCYRKEKLDARYPNVTYVISFFLCNIPRLDWQEKLLEQMHKNATHQTDEETQKKTGTVHTMPSTNPTKGS